MQNDARKFINKVADILEYTGKMNKKNHQSLS